MIDLMKIDQAAKAIAAATRPWDHHKSRWVMSLATEEGFRKMGAFTVTDHVERFLGYEILVHYRAPHGFIVGCDPMNEIVAIIDLREEMGTA